MTYWAYRKGQVEAGAYTTSDVRLAREASRDPRLPVHVIGSPTTAVHVWSMAGAVRATGAAGGSLYDWATTPSGLRTPLRDLRRQVYRRSPHISRGTRMLVCMRTTLNLADGLMAAVKAKASDEGRTATSIVEEALRAYLASEPAASSVEPLPSWGSPDGRVLMDLENKDAVWAALDESP